MPLCFTGQLLWPEGQESWLAEANLGPHTDGGLSLTEIAWLGMEEGGLPKEIWGDYYSQEEGE